MALVAHDVDKAGGMERAFVELIRRIHPRYDVVVVSANIDPSLRPLVEWKRVRVPSRPMPVKFILFFLLAGVRLRRVSSDVVHTFGAVVPNRASLASVHFCHAGFRNVTGRSHPPTGPRLRRLNRRLASWLGLLSERWCYRPSRTRVLAAVSEGVARELRQHYTGTHVRLTPNGVDSDHFRCDPVVRRHTRAAFSIHGDEAVALFVGGDWDWKGLDIVIEALCQARSSGAAVSLWVVGQGDQRRFADQVRLSGVGGAVHFFGQRRDVERFYQAADIFVLPSLYETFSLVTYEAAAAGLPVVATRVSGIEELVGRDEAGILVERDAVSVGAALARLARDPELRRRLGSEGRRRAHAYTWQLSVASIEELYQELLAAQPLSRQRV